MTVILDNGHGINTPGKRSPIFNIEGQAIQLFEYEFNRYIVNSLSRKLQEARVPCVRLVPEIEDISLGERARRANRIWENSIDAFLISIHANLGGGTGIEVFTYHGKSESDTIAEIISQQAKQEFPEKRFRADTSDGDLDKEAGFYILKRTKCPAVLTENFFMDNEKDFRILTSTKGRVRIVNYHFQAIMKYLRLKRPELYG